MEKLHVNQNQSRLLIVNYGYNNNNNNSKTVFNSSTYKLPYLDFLGANQLVKLYFGQGIHIFTIFYISNVKPCT